MSEHPLKQACALARALMPLEIEGAASEESARYVKEHISACTACAIAYGEEKQRQRQAMLDAAAREGERFRRDMQRLKKKRALRRALAIVGAVALALGLIVGGFGLRAYLTDSYHVLASPGECGVALYRLENGWIVGRYEYGGQPFRVYSGFGYGDGSFEIINYTTVIHHSIENKQPFFDTLCCWLDGKVYAVDLVHSHDLTHDEDGGIAKLVLTEEIADIHISNNLGEGRFEEETIWRAGEDIPLYEGVPLDSYGQRLYFASLRAEFERDDTAKKEE